MRTRRTYDDDEDVDVNAEESSHGGEIVDRESERRRVVSREKAKEICPNRWFVSRERQISTR